MHDSLSRCFDMALAEMSVKKKSILTSVTSLMVEAFQAAIIVVAMINFASDAVCGYEHSKLYATPGPCVVRGLGVRTLHDRITIPSPAKQTRTRCCASRLGYDREDGGGGSIEA